MTVVIQRMADVLVANQIGRTRWMTPEGYLYCEGVPIARTGALAYRADEMPEIPTDGRSPMVIMEREPEVLFHPETISSFQGKDVTIEHPSELLSPDTWRGESVGTVLNPRRGDGAETHYLLADLIIKDKEAIDEIEKGLVEVSCGYDADREPIRPGIGRFKAILGNHVALVEKGRCGPTCAIGDSEETTMAPKQRTVWDRLRTAFKAGDEAAFNEELETAQTETAADEPQKVIVEVRPAQAEIEAPAEETEFQDEAPETAADPLAALMSAISALTERLDRMNAPASEAPAADEDPASEIVEEPTEETTEENPEESGEEIVQDEAEDIPEEEKKDEEEPAADPVMDRAAFQSVVAKAEILSPGIKIPAFDAKSTKKTIADSMCSLRKRSLESAFADPKRRAFVTQVTGSKPAFDKMPCGHMRVVFDAASALAKASNNAPRMSLDHKLFPQGRMTPAKMQEMIVAHRKGGNA